MSDELLHILDSPRVSTPSRKVLQERLEPLSTGHSEYTPQLLTPAAMTTLRAVISRLLPDAGSFEIAERLETQIATSPGDGWRYDSLPADGPALAGGLNHLEEEADGAFSSLDIAHQDALLLRVQKGQVQWSGIDAARWFEELLALATAIYVSHPEVMMAMGFDGFADEPSGWTEIGLGNTQPWEPAPGVIAGGKAAE